MFPGKARPITVALQFVAKRNANCDWQKPYPGIFQGNLVCKINFSCGHGDAMDQNGHLTIKYT